MRRASPLVAASLLLLPPSAPPADAPHIEWNDNQASAGQLEDGELQLDLEVRRGDWYPLGEEKPPLAKLAFSEVGEEPRVPGPMIRVPESTEVRATVTNPLEVPLEVQGLASRHDPNLEREGARSRTELSYAFLYHKTDSGWRIKRNVESATQSPSGYPEPESRDGG